MPAEYLDYQKALKLDWIHASGYEGDVSQSSAYFKGSGVTIGIIDNGVQGNHPDITGNFAGRFHSAEIEGDDANLPSSFDYGLHGTHVAGIAAAAGSSQIYGVSPLAKLYDMPTIEHFSAADFLLKFKLSIDFAIDSITNSASYPPIRVLNCSFSFGLEDINENPELISSLRESIINAYNHGIVICFATANDNLDDTFTTEDDPGGNDTPGFGSMVLHLDVGEYVLSVGALEDIDVYSDYPLSNSPLLAQNVRKADFSNYGKRTLGRNGVSAPGTSILSSVPPNSYDVYNGTSMASPFIAGLAAMIIGFYIKAGLSVSAQHVMRIIKACVLYPSYSTNLINDGSNYVYTDVWDEDKIYIKGWNKYTGFGFTNFELISRVLMKMKEGGNEGTYLTKQNLPEGKRRFDTLPAGWPDTGPPPFSPPTDADFT